jgi:hypothetical protein
LFSQHRGVAKVFGVDVIAMSNDNTIKSDILDGALPGAAEPMVDLEYSIAILVVLVPFIIG